VFFACASCSHPQAAPPATPVEAPPPPPAPVSSLIATSVLVGSYHLQVEIQSGNKPEQRGRPAPQASLTLASGESEAQVDDETRPQHAATITMPGYTRRGRRARGRGRSAPAESGQSASWWALGGDSLAVEFAQGPRSRIQLRGQSHSGSIRGDI